MSDADFAWKFIMTVGVLMALIKPLLPARRNPPVTEELYRDFATKVELTSLRADLIRSIDDLFTREHADIAAISDQLGAIQRSLGLLDGKLSRCPSLCPPK